MSTPIQIDTRFADGAAVKAGLAAIDGLPEPVASAVSFAADRLDAGAKAIDEANAQASKEAGAEAPPKYWDANEARLMLVLADDHMLIHLHPAPKG